MGKELRFGSIQMPDVVFCGILSAALILQFQDPMVDSRSIRSFGYNVILMEHVAQKVSVIHLVNNAFVDVRRQYFKPVGLISAQSDVQRDDIFDLAVVNSPIADCRTGHCKSMKEGFLAFFLCAFKEVASWGRVKLG